MNNYLKIDKHLPRAMFNSHPVKGFFKDPLQNRNVVSLINTHANGVQLYLTVDDFGSLLSNQRPKIVSCIEDTQIYVINTPPDFKYLMIEELMEQTNIGLVTNNVEFLSSDKTAPVGYYQMDNSQSALLIGFVYGALTQAFAGRVEYD